MALQVGVVGGGISGLASALHLVNRGHAVTLFEADDRLGGLGASFAYRDASIERFYHCILPSDESLLRLIRAVGMERDLTWRRTTMGFMVAGRAYPMNTPWDLIRFEPLPIVDRVRLGLMALRPPRPDEMAALDETTAVSWLTRRVGRRAVELLWRPLLEAKMGSAYSGIPALWLASRMQREKNAAPEVRGHLTGGYRSLIDRLESTLSDRGARIVLRQPVRGVDRVGDRIALRFDDHRAEIFDLVVMTLPLVEFQRATRGLALPHEVSNLALDYQGVVSGVFLTREPLSRYYWMPIVASGAQCQGVVEMSNLVPTDRTHGLHVNYLMNYVHRSAPLYQLSDTALLDRYQADLSSLFPHAAGTVVDRFLFRAPFVEPLWTRGYGRARPPVSVLPGRLYLACTAQVYPNVNSWNSCCAVVDEMAARINEETDAADPARVAGNVS